MPVIKSPKPIDKNKFSRTLNDPEIYYGLPKDVKFCSKCTYSNQKPNSEKEYRHIIKTKKPTLNFDKKNVCAACLISEKKKKINWNERKKELIELCNKYRRNDGYPDCIVPGSGGKDSFYAAHKLKYEFNMNPLTITYSPHIYTTWGWDNFQSWIHSGFDNYLFTPNGKVHRLLTRLAIENLFHPFQPFIMGQMFFPPKLAVQLSIPLVFYGENPTEYGNKSDEDKKPTKPIEYFTSENPKDSFISGFSLEELKKEFLLSEYDFQHYLPIDKNQIKDKTIDVQYLGYYLPWHPQECYYYAVENSNFRPADERTAGTYSKYSSIDDKIDDLHYYTTFIKFGIGRATYDSSQEIRNGEIDREEALRLVRRFDGEYSDRFEKEVFEYLSITKKEFPDIYRQFEHPEFNKQHFEKLTNKFRSPHIWNLDDKNEWQLRFKSFDILKD